MHQEVLQWLTYSKNIHPSYFSNIRVVDVGSRDVCGNSRHLFENCSYTGLDMFPGNNVDVVSTIHDYALNNKHSFDTVVSTEQLEHDASWKQSLQDFITLLKPGGLLVITVASTGRDEHGTAKADQAACPAVKDYYRNLEITDIADAVDLSLFQSITFNKCHPVMQLSGTDLRILAKLNW